MPLTVDLKPGERLQIGDATVTLVQKSGQLARLVIDADKSVKVAKLPESASIRLIAQHGIMTGT